jgi:hypothetical protein
MLAGALACRSGGGGNIGNGISDRPWRPDGGRYRPGGRPPGVGGGVAGVPAWEAVSAAGQVSEAELAAGQVSEAVSTDRPPARGQQRDLRHDLQFGQQSTVPSAVRAPAKTAVTTVKTADATRETAVAAWPKGMVAAATEAASAKAASTSVETSSKAAPAIVQMAKQDNIMLEPEIGSPSPATGVGFYRFVYNGGERAYVGVIAQEVQRVLPDAVARGQDGYLRVFYD